MTPDLAYPYRPTMTAHDRRIARRIRDTKAAIVVAVAISIGAAFGGGYVSHARAVILMEAGR